MDLTETSLKLSTTPFSINDILTSNHINNNSPHSHHQHISNRLKQFCRFRRSSLDCFIVSKEEQEAKSTDASEKNIVQLLNSNPIDMRRRMAGNCYPSRALLISARHSI
jgi:hypothetical protein